MSRRPRSQQAFEATRSRVVDAARRVFARKGFSVATMADVAEEAGYTASALYKYFEGKRDLFEAALAGAVDEMYAAARPFPPIEPNAPLEAEVDLLFGEVFTLIDQHIERFLALAAVQLGSALAAAPELAKRERASNQYWVGQVKARLETTNGSSGVGLDDASAAASLFDVLCLGVLLCWAADRSPGNHTAITDLVPMMKRMFLHGVVGASARPRPVRAPRLSRKQASRKRRDE